MAVTPLERIFRSLGGRGPVGKAKAKTSTAKAPISKGSASSKLKEGATGSDIGTQQGKAPVRPAPTAAPRPAGSGPSGQAGAPDPAALTRASEAGAAADQALQTSTPPGMARPTQNAPGDLLYERLGGDPDRAAARAAWAAFDKGESQPASSTSMLQDIMDKPSKMSQTKPLLDETLNQTNQTAINKAALLNEQSQNATRLGAEIKGDQASLTAGATQEQQLNRLGHRDFGKAADRMENRIANSPEAVMKQFDAHLGELQGKIDTAQGQINSYATRALEEAHQGKAEATSAAVQGQQAQINQNIAMINADPNMSEGQKSAAIRQARMAGGAQMAPAVGATIFQFTKLATDTITSFGQMTANLQTAGVTTFGAMATAGANAYADTTNSANAAGASVLSTRANENGNYMTAQANLQSLKATIQNAGDSLRASLLPAQGTYHADFAPGMAAYTQGFFDLLTSDNAEDAGLYGLQIAKEMGAQSQANADRDIAVDLGQMLWKGLS